MDLFKKCERPVALMDSADYDIVIKKGYNPYFHVASSKQGVFAVMDGQEKIMMGSNNYLGLTSNDEVCAASIDAIKKYGTGVSGSRYLNGTLDLHVDFEKEIAEFLGKEAALSFSTGFQSNLSIISAICSRHDYIVMDKENHASIYDACRLSFAKLFRYEHNDMAELERLLKMVPEGCGILVITDGVFSMSGDICKLPEIVEISKKYGARVMVDDAHAFGVLGKTGKGTAEHFNLTKETDIIMSTFSKSLASMGGFMAADAMVCEYVRYNSRPFIFSASIPPSNIASATAALRVLKKEPQRVERLRKISDYFRAGLKKRKIKYIDNNTPIIPIYTYEVVRTMAICTELFKRGVYVNSVMPPAAPQGGCLIRVSLTSEHTEDVVEKALDIIEDVLKTVEI
ncbi:MAG: pyridoxal phosphate-dependent aminotransferase family protein [Firmicutes bacterium]|nr:pyridoxal phosphate-dependent aminotransferase family protein [Bacillota bacterium]